LQPEYNKLGHPKHRLAGLLYVTLHKLSDIVKGRIEGTIIDFNSDIHGGSGYKRMRTQLECDFFGKIDADKVAFVLPIIYPSIKSENQEGWDDSYHKEIFGLTSESNFDGVDNPSKIKADLWQTPNANIMGSSNGSHLAGFGLMFVPALANLANGVLLRIAEKDGKQLVTIKTDKTLIPYKTTFGTMVEQQSEKQFSDIQKELIKDDMQMSENEERIWWKMARQQ